MQKPRTEKKRPELTRLPRLTPARRWLRRFSRLVSRFVVAVCTRSQVRGMEHFPRHGPALVVTNHLGDADAVLGLAFFPSPVEALAKLELYELPLLGKLIAAYGVIWVHRGQPDRRALRAALDGLNEGRLIGVAPEARESLSGSLEAGTGGAAFLAIKGNVPIVPITFTGTENKRIYGNLKRLQRTEVSLTVGPAFRLEPGGKRRELIEHGTETIMRTLAMQLPPEYRGIYRSEAGMKTGVGTNDNERA